MIKVLFICHGNICRSPMAEFVMKDLVLREHLDNEIRIDSAATSSEEIGNTIYPPAQKTLKKHGIPFEHRSAWKISRRDYDTYDMIIAMDDENLWYLERICGKDTRRKISLLMDYTERPGNVADPWYTRDFERTFRDVEEGCRGLLAYIRKYKMA